MHTPSSAPLAPSMQPCAHIAQPTLTWVQTDAQQPAATVQAGATLPSMHTTQGQGAVGPTNTHTGLGMHCSVMTAMPQQTSSLPLAAHGHNSTRPLRQHPLRVIVHVCYMCHLHLMYRSEACVSSLGLGGHVCRSDAVMCDAPTRQSCHSRQFQEQVNYLNLYAVGAEFPDTCPTNHCCWPPED